MEEAAVASPEIPVVKVVEDTDSKVTPIKVKYFLYFNVYFNF